MLRELDELTGHNVQKPVHKVKIAMNTRFVQVGIAITMAIVLFGSGVLVGREFPAHRFERIG